MIGELAPLQNKPQRSQRWGQKLRDACLIYLPAVLMLLLALGSFWLLRSSPVSPANVAPANNSPHLEQQLQQFAWQRFDSQGQIHTFIQGQHARQHPQTNAWVVEQGQVRMQNPNGQWTKVRAQSIESTDVQHQTFSLTGDVVLELGEPASPQAKWIIKTNTLQLNQSQQALLIPGAVEVIGPDLRVTAPQMRWTTVNGILELGQFDNKPGRIRAEFLP